MDSRARSCRRRRSRWRPRHVTLTWSKTTQYQSQSTIGKRSEQGGECVGMALTQAALRRIDDELSWSEPSSPSASVQSTCTGCTPTWQVPAPAGGDAADESASGRRAGYDPFAGSGTTVVEAMAGSGSRRRRRFRLQLPDDASQSPRPRSRHAADELDRALALPPSPAPAVAVEVVRARGPGRFARLRAAVDRSPAADVLALVLSRAARSARRVPHHDLDFARVPVTEYWCHKHRRECRPIERADHFLRRYPPTRCAHAGFRGGSHRCAGARAACRCTRPELDGNRCAS